MRKNIERLIPKKALADTLQIGPRALERLVNDGQLPAIRLNGRCIFRTTSLVGALPKFFVGVHLADRQKNTGFPKDWLTAVEVAERYQKSRATILRWVRKRHVPFYRFGEHTIRFRGADLDDWEHHKEREHTNDNAGTETRRPFQFS